MSLSLLLVPQGKQASILSSFFSRLLRPSLLKSQKVTPVLKSTGGDQALDLGGLGLGLSVLLNSTTNDVLANIVSLLELEQFADLGGTLGTKTERINGVGQSGERAVALLDDDHVQDRQIVGDNASTNRSSSTMPRPLGAEAVRV